MLIIARHGRTAANASGELLGRRDPSLDEVGRRQAAAIGRALAGADRVISSPLARCRETAAAIGPPVEIDERVIELDYGDLEGTPVADVSAETWRSWRADTGWRPPGGESLDELAARVFAALDGLLAESADRDIVVVSHVSPIKAAVAWSLGVGIETQWRCFVQQASISRIASRGSTPALHSFNEVAHL
ncbi:MAG: histidine phosphatase family protein [Acidimicrobiales bacterium]|nr:histidine phosphatase family protein [Acidimicrobiales bacterium]